MNIRPCTLQQNFGVRLFGTDKKEIKSFNNVMNFSNTPASRGNYFTTIRIKKADVRSVGSQYATTLTFTIDNPFFGKHEFIRQLKLLTNESPLKSKKEFMKILNAFTGVESMNCAELENQAFSKSVMDEVLSKKGRRPLTIWKNRADNMNEIKNSAGVKVKIFNADRLLEFHRIAKALASILK